MQKTSQFLTIVAFFAVVFKLRSAILIIKIDFLKGSLLKNQF